jgi:hypothetical protein
MLIDFNNYTGVGPIDQDFGYVQAATYSAGTGIGGSTSLRTTTAKTGELNNGAYLGFARQHRTGTFGIWSNFTVAGSDSAVIEVWQGDPFLAVKPSGTDLEVWSVNGGTLFTATAAISASTFSRIELQWTVSSLDENNVLNYDGRVELKVDDVIIDTIEDIQLGFSLPQGYSRDVFWNVVVFNPHGDGDKHYLTDGSGSNNTGYLPTNVNIYTADPETASGTYAEMTPSAGTDQGAMVDEASSDGDTTYLSVDGDGKTASSKKSSFTFEAFGSIGSQTIYGLKQAAYGKKTAPGYRRFRPLVLRGSTPSFASVDYPIGVGYFNWMSHVWELDPYTGRRWTLSNVNATEFGILIS